MQRQQHQRSIAYRWLPWLAAAFITVFALPVILLTAKAQGADLRHFEELGVAGVLTKPFDPMALSEQVAEVLSGAAQDSGS